MLVGSRVFFLTAVYACLLVVGDVGARIAANSPTQSLSEVPSVLPENKPPQPNEEAGTNKSIEVGGTGQPLPGVNLTESGFKEEHQEEKDVMNKSTDCMNQTLVSEEMSKRNLTSEEILAMNCENILDPDDGEDFQALLLSPLLEEGSIQKARNLSTTNLGNLTSYTGYFTVKKTCGNHLFFWFIPATTTDWTQAPVFLWLNGGPGASSMFGLFKETGPWKIVNETLESAKVTWTTNYNVIFLDQPVGTGFSYTEDGCYATNIRVVAQEVYSALLQFFVMFPELQKNKLYLSGESHAGHYLPATAVEIDKQNANATLKINLIGILVGNPLLDFRCVRPGRLLYELGIIDQEERDDMEVPVEKFNRALASGDEGIIRALFYKMRGGNIEVLTGLPSVYNVLSDEDVSLEFSNFLNRREIQKQIHVKRTRYEAVSVEALQHLFSDRLTSQASDLEYLLATGNYTVGFYVGQMDAQIPYSSLPCVLRQLKWPGAELYTTAKKRLWYVGKRLAGWVKVAGNLYEVVVRNSGHMVPIDQPEALLDLVDAVAKDNPGDELLKGLTTFKSVVEMYMTIGVGNLTMSV